MALKTQRLDMTRTQSSERKMPRIIKGVLTLWMMTGFPKSSLIPIIDRAASWTSQMSTFNPSPSPWTRESPSWCKPTERISRRVAIDHFLRVRKLLFIKPAASILRILIVCWMMSGLSNWRLSWSLKQAPFTKRWHPTLKIETFPSEKVKFTSF